MFADYVVLDVSALDALNQLQVAGQPSFVGGLISDYLNQLETLTSAIKLNLGRGDLAGLDKVSHKLKSSSGALGLKRVEAICSTIEKGARAGKLEPEAVSALEKSLPSARVALTKYLVRLT
ncbi:MAG: Hpt domain-containing protein [Proteobacteria bacterium]|nr:MAG: Hpt domain-containing protein [Pseudomonadota bacterium]